MSDTALSYSIFAVDKTGPGMRSAGGNLEKLGGIGKKVFAGLAIGGALAGAAGFAKGLIEDARESAKVGRMTEAVVKSTGMAAHISAAQVGDLATAISNKTGADDEAIQSGQNLLLTFTNVKNEAGKGNDIFNQASQAITDMTAAMNNGDVSAEKIKGSSIMLGKALNDPIKGITALSRAGVSFTEAQKKQITEMVKSGNVMGAQKMILGELKKEFGGAAAAATDPAQKATVAWGNLREQLGGYLLPVVSAVATFLSTRVIPAVSRFFDNVAHGGGAFASVRNGIAQFASFLQTSVLPVVQRLGDWFVTTGWPAIKRFAAAFWQDLQPALHQIATSFNTQLRPALESAIQKFREAWPTIQRVLNILGQVAGFIMTRVVPVLISFYAKYLATVIRVMGEVFAIAWKVIGGLIDLGAALGRAGAAVGKFATNAVNEIKALPGRVGNLAKALYQHGLDFIQGFINGVIDKAKEIPGVIKDKVVGVAKSAVHGFGLFGSPSRLTMRYGRWWSEGFAIGMKEKSADIVDHARTLIQDLKSKLDEVKDFARSIRESFQEAANPTSLDTGDDKSFGGLLKKLQDQRSAAMQFASGIKELRKRGLNDLTVGQLRDSGIGSLDTVKALLSGDVGQVNSLVRDIDQTGRQFGNAEAKNKFGINPEKKVRVVIDVDGADGELKKLIKKMVRVDGGGDVQVAFGKG